MIHWLNGYVRGLILKKLKHRCKHPCWYVDVDDTLIRWQGTDGHLNLEVEQQILRANKRKQCVIIWSAGGSKWARLAVAKLVKTYKICSILPKPTWTLDDRDPLENTIKVPFNIDAIGKKVL